MGEVRDMLYYLSLQLVTIGTQKKNKFDNLFDRTIRETVKGGVAGEKTVKNIRTEMTALFGLVKYENGYVSPSKRIDALAKSADSAQFFRSFCYFFQWPGGFNKEHVTASHLTNRIRFRPTKFILRMLLERTIPKADRYLTAAETAWFIFNDLRVTAGGEAPKTCWHRILNFRRSGASLSSKGDMIRYARDFLHYMVMANLLVESKKEFRVNRPESDAVDFIINSGDFFDGYAKCVSSSGIVNMLCVRDTNNAWIDYFSNNKDFKELRSRPEDVLDLKDEEIPVEFVDVTGTLGAATQRAAGKPKRGKIATRSVRRKPDRYDQIGATGEQIVYNFERKTLIEADRRDLADMVEDVSDNESLGYDIRSFTADGRDKFIEVKSTETFGGRTARFVWSANEVRTAEELDESYSIYRVAMARTKGVRIMEIRNPAKLRDEGKIDLLVKDYWAYCSIPSM